VEEGVTSQVYGVLASTAEVQSGQQYLNMLVSRLQDDSIAVETAIRHSSNPSREIIRYAKEMRADLVVTSGGVSKGNYDVVKEVLSELGTVSFGEVAMQPGKPQGFGFVGEDATAIITLPGNPVSSYVSFEVFVLPAIRRMMGRLPYRRPLSRALAGRGFTSLPGRRQFLRARFQPDAMGARVEPVGGPGSHLVGDLPDDRPAGDDGQQTERSGDQSHRFDPVEVIPHLDRETNYGHRHGSCEWRGRLEHLAHGVDRDQRQVA